MTLPHVICEFKEYIGIMELNNWSRYLDKTVYVTCPGSLRYLVLDIGLITINHRISYETIPSECDLSKPINLYFS